MDHTSYVDALLAIATLVSLAQHKAPKPERAPVLFAKARPTALEPKDWAVNQRFQVK